MSEPESLVYINSPELEISGPHSETQKCIPSTNDYIPEALQEYKLFIRTTCATIKILVKRKRVMRISVMVARQLRDFHLQDLKVSPSAPFIVQLTLIIVHRSISLKLAHKNIPVTEKRSGVTCASNRNFNAKTAATSQSVQTYPQRASGRRSRP